MPRLSFWTLAACALVAPVAICLTAAPRETGALGSTGWMVTGYEAGHPRRFVDAVVLYRDGGEDLVWRRVSVVGAVVDLAVAAAGIGFAAVLTESIIARRWSLRTLFILTTLAAVASCWFLPVDRADGLSDVDQANAAIRLGEEWVASSRLRSR
jgi:hypothetical protein